MIRQASNIHVTALAVHELRRPGFTSFLGYHGRAIYKQSLPESLPFPSSFPLPLHLAPCYMMDSPTRKSRTLVLCFDGTSNEYDEDVSTCAFASS